MGWCEHDLLTSHLDLISLSNLTLLCCSEMSGGYCNLIKGEMSSMNIMLPRAYKSYNESIMSYTNWSETSEWNSWILFSFLALIFCTPLWSFLLIYSHLPLAIIYYVFTTIAKQFRITFDDIDQWELFRKFIAYVWCTIGKIWHGYSIKGLENLPTKGPALLLLYHGAFALDGYFFCTTFMGSKIKNRLLKVVMHKSFWKLKGWQFFQKTVNVIPGTAESCLNSLRSGDLVLVSPGGAVEALLSDHKSYQLHWGNKLGFARVAIEAQVPIIPIFCENIREAYRVPSFLRPIFIYIRSKVSYPIPPVYGGFPVKLTTHIGKPIYYDSSCTPEELAAKASRGMVELIKQNQRLPGSIWTAIKDRWTKEDKKLK